MSILFLNSLIDSNGKEGWEMTFELAKEQHLPQCLLIPGVPGAGHFENKIAGSFKIEKAS